MRVALVAPFVAVIDDRRGQIGGAQSIVAELATGLAARGHRVTVVAPRGSHIAGATVVDAGVEADPGAAFRIGGTGTAASQETAFRAVAAWLAASRDDFDVVHGHAFDAPALDLLGGGQVLHTLHLPPLDVAVVEAARRSGARLATVSVSARDAWRAAGVPVDEVLPNGIDIGSVPPGTGSGGYLAFVGRMSAEKGADVACRVARALDLPLRLAGGRYDSGYFESEVRPRLGQDIEYVGPLDRIAVQVLLGAARATLMPVGWDEPFGLVALESLATGTPVVAYARGGLTEILVDRRSGRLVAAGDEAAFIAAVADVGRLRRRDCRADAMRFDRSRMLDAHELLYRSVSAR